jgi:hypothetical protein
VLVHASLFSCLASEVRIGSRSAFLGVMGMLSLFPGSWVRHRLISKQIVLGLLVTGMSQIGIRENRFGFVGDRGVATHIGTLQ